VEMIPKQGVRVLSSRYDFSAEWHKFLTPREHNETLEINLEATYFPFQCRQKPTNHKSGLVPEIQKGEDLYSL
jgi:hypothetical protein